jgi:sRNA-binding protein
MTIKILAVAFLALALTACESAENSNNSNENKPAAATPAQSTPAQASPAASPASTATNPAASTQLKAGDKVKVNVNGSTSDGTVVSVDEKAAKVTVKIPGQKEDKTVALSAVTKQ